MLQSRFWKTRSRDIREEEELLARLLYMSEREKKSFYRAWLRSG